MTDNESNKKININFKLFAVLGGVLLIALAVNVIVSFKTGAFVSKKVAEAKEAARPAELQLLIINDANCADCFKFDGLLAGLKQFNIKITDEKQVDWQSDEGKALIARYKIDKLPALIVGGEINKEVKLKNAWPQIGEVIDNNFVLRRLGAPYIEVASGKEKGQVEMFLLADESCADCYDVRMHQQILAGFGLPAQDAKILSMGDSEGRAMKNKYGIGMMPTFVLRGELDAYPDLQKVWPQVGTVESDGAYVFREGVKQMGVYKNMMNGKIIRPVASTSTAQ